MTCTAFTAYPWDSTVTSLEEFRALKQRNPLGIRLWREAIALMEHHRAASLTVAQQRVDSAKARRAFHEYCDEVQILRIVTAMWAYAATLND